MIGGNYKDSKDTLRYKEIYKRNKKREGKKNIDRTVPKVPYLTVCADTPPKDLARAIYGCVSTHTWCQMSGVLELATYNMVKAFTIATGWAAQVGVRLVLTTGFIEPRPCDSTGRRATGFVFNVHSNLIKDENGKIVITNVNG
jgi:stage V sporulation protein SpoVS